MESGHIFLLFVNPSLCKYNYTSLHCIFSAGVHFKGSPYLYLALPIYIRLLYRSNDCHILKSWEKQHQGWNLDNGKPSGEKTFSKKHHMKMAKQSAVIDFLSLWFPPYCLCFLFVKRIFFPGQCSSHCTFHTGHFGDHFELSKRTLWTN